MNFIPKISLIILSGLITFNAIANKPNLLSSKLMDKPPTIDGVINADEWKDAAETFGSRIHSSIFLEPRRVKFYFGCSRKNVYFACQSELPPEKMKLLSRVRKRDGRVYGDDAVELLILPPHKKAVYQAISNSIGTLFDVKYKMQNGGVTASAPLKWQPKIRTASRLDKGYWNLEMEIPFEDLEMEGAPPIGKWRIQMTRDWKQPAKWTCWNKATVFCNPDAMGEIIISENGPVLKLKDLGANYNKGDINCTVSAYNPSNEKINVKCRMDITSITSPRVSDELKSVPAGKNIDFKLNFNDKTKAVYECKILAKNADNGQILLRERFNWEPKTGKLWHEAKEKKANLDFSFYPYRKSVKAGLNLDTLKNRKDIKQITFKIIGPEGKTLVEKKLANIPSGKEAEVYLEMPEMPVGDYKVIAELQLKNKEKPFSCSRKFIYKKFPWEHNNIGCEDIIIPPFKPLKVDKNNRTVQGLMTGYRIKNGFWDAVFAEGENILSAPVRLVVNDGKTIMTEKDFKFISEKDSEVKSMTSLTGETLSLLLKHTYDYDGMCKLEMTLKPELKKTIESAYLEIPLKNSVAKLMHTTNNNMRYNPAQYIPEGKDVVWTSKEAKDNPKIAGNFLPYFWMGYIYKGFCWFTASDKGWSVDREKPALEVIRKENSVILRVNIVNKPMVLEKAVTYVMGFQPTPVKPRPKYWRRISEHWKPKDVKHALKMDLFAGSQTYACRKEGSPWPADHDYTIIQMTARKNRQRPYEADKEAIDKYIKKHFGKCSVREYKFAERHIHRGVRFSKKCDYSIAYVNARASELDWEQYDVYMDEWWGAEYRANLADGYNNTFSKSYLDMRLYYVQKLVQEGFDGIYYDNVRDWPVFDPVRGPAYKLPNGEVQPYFDIFDMRELIKRTATMLYLNKKTFPDGRPILTAHMTNTNLIPYMSLCSITLDMEAHYGASDFQTRFSEGYILTETLGTQTGCIPEVLVKITGNDQLRVSRTFIATALAFDFPIVLNAGGLKARLWMNIKTAIMKFGYGTPETKIYPCWKKQDFVKTETKNVKLALYKNEKQAMLVISDFGNSGNVKVDISGLNFKQPKVINKEDNKEIPVQNGIISINVPKHDFRLLFIKND